MSVTYVLHNGITTEPQSFTLTHSSTGPVASCSYPGSVTAPAGGDSSPFVMTCTMGGTAGPANITLQAAGDFATVTAALAVTVRDVTVSVKGGVAIVNNLAARADTFTVANNENASVSLALAAVCTATVPVAGCAASPASLPLGPMGSASVVLSFEPPTGGANADSGRIVLRASEGGTLLDSAWSSVALAHATVVRSGSTPVVHPPHQGGLTRTAGFLVTNTALYPVAYSLQVACSGAGITGCTGPTSTTTLATNQGQAITTSFNTLAPGDTGRVTLRALY